MSNNLIHAQLNESIIDPVMKVLSTGGNFLSRCARTIAKRMPKFLR